MTIAYLPIDIDVQLPDEQKLLDFCQETRAKDWNQNIDSMEHWNKIPVRGRLKGNEWYDVEKFKNCLYSRFIPNLGPSLYANDIDKVFPEIPYMLDQLPFLEFSFVVMLMQREQVNTHMDAQQRDIIVDPTEIAIDIEPRRYNVLMNKHESKSFYVSENKDSEKIYPNITKKQACFSICERYHWHGADYVEQNKIMLCVLGILDREKHRQLVNKSLKKYKDQAIIFPDPQ